jgi:hypothetical protein
VIYRRSGVGVQARPRGVPQKVRLTRLPIVLVGIQGQAV